MWYFLSFIKLYNVRQGCGIVAKNYDLFQALNDYANENYQKSYKDIKDDNLFYDKKGNIINDDNLAKHKNDKLFIAIKDGKALPIYLDNEKNKNKNESSYNDRKPLKWYKLIITAFYALFKAIKMLINAISSLIGRQSLNKALAKASLTHFKASKEKERLESVKKQELANNKKLEVEPSNLNKEIKASNVDLSQEIKDINKAQLERERELNEIRKNLKSFNKDAHNKETELKQIKDNLIKIDMDAVEEKLRLSRLKGLAPQNKYQKMVNKSSNLFERMDMIDYVLHNKGYQDIKDYDKPKVEKQPLKSNPFRKSIEVEELKNEISPIERIFNNLGPTKENKLTK